MKILDLMISGRENKIYEMGLEQEVFLEQVFYEEPIE
jgi:hypothetical protein